MTTKQKAPAPTEPQQTIEDAAPQYQIAEFNDIDRTLAQVRARVADVAYDLRSVKGDKQARDDRKALVSLRTRADAVRKDLNRKDRETIAAAIESRNEQYLRIEAAITPLEKHVDDQIKADEKRRDDERAARVAAEAERVAKIRSAIESISNIAIRAVGQPSAKVAEKIESLRAITLEPATFAELLNEARTVYSDVLLKLTDLHAAAVASEAEAERQRIERIDLDRQRAEQAERDRVQREAQEADRLAAEARLAEERRKFDEQRTQAAEAQRQEDERRAEARRQEDAEMEARRAALRADQDAADARARQARADEERKEAEARAERQRLADEQAAAERAAQEAAFAADKKRRDAAGQMLAALQAWVEVDRDVGNTTGDSDDFTRRMSELNPMRDAAIAAAT